MDAFTPFPSNSRVDLLPSSHMDYSNFSWNEDWPSERRSHDLHISQVMDAVSMAMYSIALVLGAAGNGIVIFLTGFHLKKTVTTVWYLNLAVADFVFAICLSSEIIYIALDHWPLGSLLCKLDVVLTFLNMFASVFFLTAISADRCASVVHPIWALNHRTLWLASVVAVIIWATALALSLPYFIFRETEPGMDGTVRCTYNFGLEDASALRTQRFMVIAEFVVGFLIPFHIILACYCAIVVKLRGKVFGRFSRSFKIIVVVVVAFFCCWFPHHLFAILDTLEDDSLERKAILDIGIPLANGLVCLNSCLNPLLYAFIGPDCRRTNWHSFLSTFKGAFSENWAVSSFASNRTASSSSGVESSMV